MAKRKLSAKGPLAALAGPTSRDPLQQITDRAAAKVKRVEARTPAAKAKAKGERARGTSLPPREKPKPKVSAKVQAERAAMTHTGPSRVAGVKATGNQVQIKPKRGVVGDIKHEVKRVVTAPKRAADSVNEKVDELVHPGRGHGGVFAPVPKPPAERVKRSKDPRTAAALANVRKGRVVASGISNVPEVPVRAAVGVGTAFEEDPVGTTKATGKGLKDAALGLAPATVKTVKQTVEGTKHGDPLRGVKGAAKDYAVDLARRYEPLTKGTEAGQRAFVERVKKEGATSEGLDFASVFAPGKGLLSRRLESAAKTGVLGAERKAIVTEPRFDRRVSAGSGPGAIRHQEMPDGYFAKARAKKKDARAFAGQQRAVREADDQERARARGQEDAPAKGKADITVRAAVKGGQVVPSRRARPGVKRNRAGKVRGLEARRTPSKRKLARAQQREGYALPKGRLLAQQKAVQATEVVRPLNRSQAALSRGEQKAYKIAVQLGVRTAPQLKAVAEERLRQIEAERGTPIARAEAAVAEHAGMAAKHRASAAKAKTPEARARRLAAAEAADERAAAARAGVADAQRAEPQHHDEVAVLQKMVADPEKYVGPKLAAAAELAGKAGRRAAEHDPTIPAERATVGRVAAQAQFLGLERGGTLVKDAEKAATKAVRRARSARARATRKQTRAGERASVTQGRAEIQVERAERARPGQLAHAEKMIGVHGRAAANHRARAARSKNAEVIARSEKGAARSDRLQAAARERVTQLKTPETRPVRPLAALEKRRGRSLQADRAVAKANDELQAAKATKAELRRQRKAGAKYVPGTKEDHDTFARRVAAEASARHGLAPGEYFPSVAHDRPLFSSQAIGGSKAVKGSRARTGQTFAIGGEANRPQLLQQALNQNVKRRFNYELVAKTNEAHSAEWSRGRTGNGVTIKQGEALAAKEGVDPNSMAWWNGEIYDRALKDALSDVEGEHAGVVELDSKTEHEAFERASTPPTRHSADYATQTGWKAVPKALHDEMMAGTTPSGKLGRAWDISKAWQSRILLGTSPPWLLFQVASNGILAGLGGANPLDFIAAQRWWKGLDDAQRQAIDPYIGAGAFHDSITQTHMGAASDGAIVNAYRAFKASSFWHKPRKPLRGGAVRDLNPLDALFKADKAQNDFFRRTVLYSAAKREAYKRMGADVGEMQRLHDRLVPKLLGGKDPHAAMDALLRSQPDLERLAQHVNDFLGDYLTYTSKERHTLGRAAMFYGYLRFSLRFSFYTMPVRHPVMTSIALNLGKLQEDEIQRLLGGAKMPWALGAFYYADDGQLKSIDISRANPFLNQVTQVDTTGGPARTIASLGLGMAPPIVVSLIDQVYGASSFTGKGFKVLGETQARAAGKIPASALTRVFVEDMLTLNGYYRTVSKATSSGDPEGADSSLLLGRRYIHYKDPAILASIEKDKQLRPKSVLGRVVQQELPVLPRNSNVADVAASMNAQAGKVPMTSSGGAAVAAPAEDPIEALQEQASDLADQSAAADAALDDLQEQISDMQGGG